MIEQIVVGRSYENGNKNNEEGKPILIESNETIFYKSNEEWIEYNTQTNTQTEKEKEVKLNYI